MRFYTVILPTVLVGFSTLMGVEAMKCACNGGSDNSKRACDLSGHIYGVTGCGFSGCCINPDEMRTGAIVLDTASDAVTTVPNVENDEAKRDKTVGCLLLSELLFGYLISKRSQ